MMKYKANRDWTSNRPIYFQIGMIITLLLCLNVINIERNYIVKPQVKVMPEVDEMEQIVSVSLQNNNPPPPRFQVTEEVLDEVLPINTPSFAKISTNIESTINHEADDKHYADEKRIPLPLPEYEQNIKEVVPNIVYEHVEKMPLMPDCVESNDNYKDQLECTMMKIQRLIRKKLKYPVLAKENNVEATVTGSFIIDETGKVYGLKIEREQGLGFDEAVLDVMNDIPDFVPGEQNDEKVKVKMYLPIKFRLISD